MQQELVAVKNRKIFVVHLNQTLSSFLSPAAGSRGGRFPGEVPVFAGRDRRLPAGQEDRGPRSQQVPIVDATRDSVGGGLKGNEANPKGSKKQEANRREASA